MTLAEWPLDSCVSFHNQVISLIANHHEPRKGVSPMSNRLPYTTPTVTRICVRCRGSQLDHLARMTVRTAHDLNGDTVPAPTTTPRPCPRCEGQGVEPRPTDRSFLTI